jgi:RNA polymerase sigma-70 factor (ECF subfamily)
VPGVVVVDCKRSPESSERQGGDAMLTSDRHEAPSIMKFSDKQDAKRVREALIELPATQRLAIALRYYENLGLAEIAQILSVTPKAVERLLDRGRKRLAELLHAREDH